LAKISPFFFLILEAGDAACLSPGQRDKPMNERASTNKHKRYGRNFDRRTATNPSGCKEVTVAIDINIKTYKNTIKA
jgi:hypothetical protein